MNTRYVIDENGTYVGAFGEGVPLPEGIEVDEPPACADQSWLFPGWGPSPAVMRRVENEWRDAEMGVAAENVTAIQFGDPEALPGTEAEWKAYWVALKSWVEGKGHYPDIAKRPKRPA